MLEGYLKYGGSLRKEAGLISFSKTLILLGKGEGGRLLVSVY